MTKAQALLRMHYRLNAARDTLTNLHTRHLLDFNAAQTIIVDLARCLCQEIGKDAYYLIEGVLFTRAWKLIRDFDLDALPENEVPHGGA